MSSTTDTNTQSFTQDYGTNTPAATETHHLSLYKAASGALVFGAGTVQWSWGLDSITTGHAPDPNMQQATVNLFADMGAQPFSLLPGLVAATTSTDTTAPTSTITSPTAGANLTNGAQATITGTAADTGGGVVAGVEVSTDGGTTWHPATGTTNWTYTWTVRGNPTTTIKSRAVDDSGNLETPTTGATVNVPCPCSLFGTTTPAAADAGDPNAVSLGVKFTTTTFGTANGIRFYKATANTGTHVGQLYNATGQLLATATFTAETASGWQNVTFSNPVPINPNTTYIASYYAPNGHYAADANYFYPPPEPQGYGTVDSPPLHALRQINGTTNGVYTYGGTPTLPVNSYNATNYWVDVTFSP
jgi:hypothetical protein